MFRHFREFPRSTQTTACTGAVTQPPLPLKSYRFSQRVDLRECVRENSSACTTALRTFARCVTAPYAVRRPGQTGDCCFRAGLEANGRDVINCSAGSLLWCPHAAHHRAFARGRWPTPVGQLSFYASSAALSSTFRSISSAISRSLRASNRNSSIRSIGFRSSQF